MADKERRFYPTVLAGDALLLLCALMGFAGSFLSLYGDPSASIAGATALDRCAAGGGTLLLCAALFALAALAAFSLPRFWGWAAGALAALWALTAALCWTEAVQGAALAVREISALFARRVAWGRAFEYDPGLTFLEECAAVRLFLILLLAGLALLAGWAVVRARRWWLVLALTLPFLLPGLLADLYPDWLWFMALAACWCVMLVTSMCRWAAPSGRGKLTLTVFPAVAAVLAAITLIFPREGYTRPPWALKAREDLMNFTSRTADFFSQWDGPFQGAAVTYVGAAEEADLAHAGPLDFYGRSVLRVSSDYDGRLYLRGSSLAVYEDGVWKALPEGAYQKYDPAGEAASPLYFPALLDRDSPVYTVTVDNMGAVGACVYTPYFPLPQDAGETGMLPVEDAYFARKQGQWSHTVTFVERRPTAYTDISSGGTHIMVPQGTGVNVRAGLRNEDADADGAGVSARGIGQYREFAYEHYLDVPKELRAPLEEICQMIRLSSAASPSSISPWGSPWQEAEGVAAYLAGRCEYDPEAPAVPDGADPVLYFLNESRRGYCMHYASSAALILRTMGIPARYVSGFTVDSKPGRQLVVPDRAAHAWVEVWVDGFGWYPVEVTPAAAFEWYERGTLASDDPVEETAEPTAAPTPSPAEEPTEAPTPAASMPMGGGEDPNAPAQAGPDFTALLGVLKGLARLAGALALLWLAQLLPKRFRARRMAGPEPNRAALACYGYLCRLERWGGRMDGRAVELAQKARFSQHTLTEEELGLLRRMVDRERTRVCVAPALPKRLAARLFWGRPKPPMSLTDEE